MVYLSVTVLNMLWNKLSGAGGAGGPALIGFTFVASASTNIGASTITIPATAQAGDLCVLLDSTVNTTATLPTNVVPSGFTQIMTAAFVRANGTTSARMTCSYKVLVSGDAGSSITGLGNTNPRKIALVFRPDSSITTVSYSTANTQTESPNAGTSEALSLVMDSKTDAIGIGYIGASQTITDMTSSPTALDATIAPGDQFQRCGYKIFTSTAADQTITATKTSSAVNTSWNIFTTFYLTAQ